MRRVEPEDRAMICPNRVAVHHRTGAVGREVIRGIVPATREIDGRLRGRERQATTRDAIPKVIVERKKALGLSRRCADRVADRRVAARHTAFTFECAERAPANVGETACRPGAASREELDHTGDGVGAVRDACRSP